MYGECRSAYIIVTCCVILFALLVRWWLRARRHANAPSFPPAPVVRSGLACVSVASSADNCRAGAVSFPPAPVVRSGLACAGGSVSLHSSSRCPSSHTGAVPLPLAQDVQSGLACACVSAVFWLRLLCTNPFARSPRCRRRATTRHRGNRPTPTPWHNPITNVTRRARASAHSSSDHPDTRLTSVLHSRCRLRFQSPQTS